LNTKDRDVWQKRKTELHAKTDLWSEPTFVVFIVTKIKSEINSLVIG
jgi:hypothetical protein